MNFWRLNRSDKELAASILRDREELEKLREEGSGQEQLAADFGREIGIGLLERSIEGDRDELGRRYGWKRR